MSYNAITNLQEIVIDDLIANTATIDTALIQSLDANVGVIDTLTSTTATITSANIPTLTNTTLTSSNASISNLSFTGATGTNINLNGIITIPQGSVSAPSLTFTGDTNTGIFSSASDTINLTTNAVSRLSASNSGINVPSLTASKLVLTNASSILTSSLYTDSDFARLTANNTFSGSNTFSGTGNTFNNTLITDTRIVNNYELLRNIIRFYPPVLENCPSSPAFSDPFVPANTTNNGIQTADGQWQSILYLPARDGIIVPNGQPFYYRTNAGFTSTLQSVGSTMTSNLTLSGGYTNRLYVFVFNANLSLFEYMGYVIFNSIPTSNQFNGRANSFTLPSTRGSANNILTTDGAGTTSWASTISTGNITSSGVITIPLGSVSVPSLTFTGDTNTGIFSSGADSINLTTNAISRLIVSNSGINVPSLTASKLVLTDASKNIVSSLYTDSDFARLGASSNTFTGTALSLVPSTASNAEIKILTNDGLVSRFSLKEFTDSYGTEFIYNGTTNLASIVKRNASTETIMDWDIGNALGTTRLFKPVVFLSTITMPLGSVSAPSLTFSGDTDTGIFSSGADSINLTTNAVSRLIVNNSGVNVPSLTASKLVLTDGSDNLVSSSFTDTDLATKASPQFTGQITVPQGTAGAPSISITGDLNTGIYQSAVDNIDISTGGASRCNISNSGIYTQDIRVNSGLDGYLTYFQPTTKYLSSYNQLDLPVSTATQTALNLKSNIASPTFTGIITIPLGSVSDPSLTFTGDTNTGIFSSASDTINLTTNAVSRLIVSNSGVNIPSLTASKLVLTDGSDNLVSSVYTDTDILNNSRIETFPRAVCSALLTFTTQRAYYTPIIVGKTMTFSTISFGLQIPAGATISAPYMGSVAYCIYNTSSLTTTNAYLTSSTTSSKVSGTDSGVLPLVLTNTPSTKSAGTIHTFTFASPVSLTAGQYFLATLFQTASFDSGFNIGTVSFTPGSTTMSVNTLNNGLLLGQGATLPFDVNLSPTQTFTGRIDNGAGLAGTVLTITVAPTQYNIFIGQYIFGGSISGGTKITAFGTGTGGVGTYTVSISQLVGSTSISSTSCRLQTSGGADLTISSGLATGRTGNYTLSSAFLGTTGISSATTTSGFKFTYGATGNPFTVMNYSNAISTQNYCFEQSGLTTLPASPTLTSSAIVPYVVINT